MKCGSYLLQGINLVLVDVVPSRSGDLHGELLGRLRATPGPVADLYAAAYRPVPAEQAVRLEYWPEALAVGEVLPTVPLWISPDVCLPLNLEQAYTAACSSSRIE